MSANSMTGFARVRRTIGSLDAILSVKSVNHRGLDLHFHMPPVLEPFEPLARAAIKTRVERGHIQVHASLERHAENGTAAAINTAALERWMLAYREAARILGSSQPPDPGEALRVAGVLQTDAAIAWSPELARELSACFDQALAELNAFRAREGAAIAQELQDRATQVESLAARMEAIRATATVAFQNRLREKLGDLLRGASVEPHRIAQEAAILADRSDISEELMRLKTHAAQLRVQLEASGEKGKKLDFLLQEMNRETNTVLSKTSGLGDHGLTITDLALAAKAEIDKMREQSLNLE